MHAGHLEEMVRASGVTVAVSLPAVPLLPGAAAAVAAGYVSSLHASNQYAVDAVANRAEAAQHPLFPLLTDPQTAGGLLAGVPAAAASECLRALHCAGYTEAAEIGRVRQSALRLRHYRTAWLIYGKCGTITMHASKNGIRLEVVVMMRSQSLQVVERSDSPTPIVIELTLVPPKKATTTPNQVEGASQAVAGD